MQTHTNPSADHAGEVSRRDFARLAALGLAAGLTLPRSLSALLQEQQTVQAVFNWRPVGERARVAFEMGGNSLVLGSGASALLVDCKNAGFGWSLKNEAEAYAGPMTFVINTHHHADHSGGNAAFSGSARLLAHRNAEPRILATFDRYIRQMTDLRGRVTQSSESWAEKLRADAMSFLEDLDQLKATDFGPNDLVTNDGRDFRVGELRVELIHVGPGHTDNDIFVHIPGLNIIHTGDLLFHRMHPFIDRAAGATTLGWIDSLDAMIERCNDNTIVVPGHGDVTNVTGLRGMKEYLRKTRDSVQREIDAGRTRDQIVEMEFPHFQGLGFAQLKGRSVGAIYDELTEQ